MWKFALYSSVKTSRNTTQTQASYHDHEHHSHPTTIAAENRMIEQQRKINQNRANARPMLPEDNATDNQPTSNGRERKHDCEVIQEVLETDASSCLCCPRVKCMFNRSSKVQRSDSFLARFSMTNQARLEQECQTDEESSSANISKQSESQCGSLRRKLTQAITPASGFLYAWLIVISLCILYNITLIIARVVFTQLQEKYFVIWTVLDYICDLMYLLDMLIRFRTGYLEDGIMVQDSKKLARKYIQSTEFWFDLVSVLPTDILYLILGMNPAVRFNRLLRWQRLREFFDKTIRRTSYPNLFRILNLILYILIIVHWNACFYYAISGLIGYGTDGWVYPNATNATMAPLSRKYVYSFYWSTLTLLTIGETPHPERDLEYLFVVIDFLMGVLIFATIVGNVGSMITNMNHDRSIFTQKLDGLKRYMKIRKVTPHLESKVISWFDYLWSNRHSLDEEEVLDALPEKLRAEIAIHVHLDTLRQVNIFKDCEPGLLVELVLKLKLQVFSPGDYVCRKGDIGREMYIVKQGVLKVMGDDGQVFATLSGGNVFGEISILEIPGSKTGNRRIANVMSVGFADCFVLGKHDLWAILRDYPVTRQKLIDRGKDILALDNMLGQEHAESVSSVNTSITGSGATGGTNGFLINSKIKSVEDRLEDMTKQMSKLSKFYQSQQKSLIGRINELEDAMLSLKTIDLLQSKHPRVDEKKQNSGVTKLTRETGTDSDIADTETGVFVETVMKDLDYTDETFTDSLQDDCLHSELSRDNHTFLSDTPTTRKEHSSTSHPHTAVLTDLTANHTDQHHDMAV